MQQFSMTLFFVTVVDQMVLGLVSCPANIHCIGTLVFLSLCSCPVTASHWLAIVLQIVLLSNVQRTRRQR